jgi:homoserine/homoserine lactone efflux protein
MITLGPWLAFVGLSAVAVLTPGPTMLAIVGHAIARGVRATLPMVLGNAVGIAGMVVTAMAGVAGVLSRAPGLQIVVQLVGAAYLAWHGVQIWKQRASAPEPGAGSPRIGPFGRGLLLVWTNPKAILFFGAVLPQFVRPGGSVPLQLGILATTFITLELAVTTSAAVVAGRLVRAEGGAATTLRTFRGLGGLVLVGAAVLLGLAALRSTRSAEGLHAPEVSTGVATDASSKKGPRLALIQYPGRR